jgi:molybdenum cofactor cytidylyltransferase
LPVVDPSSRPSGRPGADLAAVVLAAGDGSRFEGDAVTKLLATVAGVPIVRRAVGTLLAAEAGFDPVVAVVGSEAARVEAALSGLPVVVVRNDDYAAGQSTSVRRGVAAVRDLREGGDAGPDAVVVALGDMPVVAPASVDALVAAYRAGAGSALAAGYRGRRGNPVLFDRRHLDRLAGVVGDVGGREVLVDGDDSAVVETGDPGVLRDVDTDADLARVRAAVDGDGRDPTDVDGG